VVLKVACATRHGTQASSIEPKPDRRRSDGGRTSAGPSSG
jgi:hypothetical protein